MPVVELWAWCSEDDQGREGIVAFPTSYGVMAGVATTRQTAERMRAKMEVASLLRNRPVRLYRFTAPEEMDIINV